MTPLEAARKWVDRDFLVVPVPHQQKHPVLPVWQELRLTREDLPQYFDSKCQNLGILLGDQLGTADVDCDCAEAIAAAVELAPPTGMSFGRESKKTSHHIYRCQPPVRSRKFLDPINKSTIVELRCQKKDGSIGLQTVVPPSVHPTGEKIRFEPGRNRLPGQVEASTLETAVSRIAAASLLARHWTKEGSRHYAFLALAGILVRAGWNLDEAVNFHRAIYRALWGISADFSACEAEVKSTFTKHALDEEITGFKSLAELVDKVALAAALEWLEIQSYLPTPKRAEWTEVAPFVTRHITPLTPQMFPGFLGEMVSAVASATETPFELSGMLGLRRCLCLHRW